ncbi:hypothetical protein PALU110988_16885 [Paenibacillus lupini]|uniref:hypothetical protein n=1 Tax=Paenibacillus lupini TaxID=1450204 RepID=UPI00142255C7|nr:hypothetical protein [Paenibacillus lupini]NIK24533.1 hypothetical protein [Paenibacillus lupini]
MRGILISVLLLLSLLTGCSSNQTDVTAFKDQREDRVSLFTSLNYEIIRDRQSINEIDHVSDSLKNPVMIRVFLEITNKGEQTAKSIKIRLNEPLPMKYVQGSGNEGNTNGILKKNESYEYYITYTFADEADFKQFLNETTLSVLWQEEGSENEITLNLPSNPIKGEKD